MGCKAIYLVLHPCSFLSISTPVVVTDKAKRIVTVLLGQPSNGSGRGSWKIAAEETYSAVQELQEGLDFRGFESLPKPPGEKVKHNRRGPYYTSSFGIGFGSGSTVSRSNKKQRIFV
jgi:hypothetical protein